MCKVLGLGSAVNSRRKEQKVSVNMELESSGERQDTYSEITVNMGDVIILL